MLCYRCGGHVKDASEKCTSCGQQLAPSLKPGSAAGFGVGNRRHRVAVEGAPYRAGDIVAGRFLVRDLIGQGPLGWMYRAVEISTDTAIALKVLSPRFLQAPEEKRVFLAEQQKAQRLSHQNIAQVYQAGEDQDRPFIVLQLLEGLTLRRIMELRRQKGQGFSLQEVEPIVAQIAAALEAAARTFAHGNLKPDNVVVLPDLLKLTDFGLASSLPRAPFMAAQRASFVHRYLAPEFLLGEPLDARTDVFSLGVLLGELLGDTHPQAQRSLLLDRPQLSPRLEEMVRHAVAPRPVDRFANANELLAELSALVMAAPRQSPPPVDDDADDVVIEEVHTDPRLRIARALAAQDTAPLMPAPFVAPPFYEPAVTRPERTASRTGKLRSQDEVTARHQVPLALRAMMVPPAEDLASEEIAAIEEQPAQPQIQSDAAVQRATAAEVKLIEVAASVGATPALLTAETAVRAAPTEAPPQAQPEEPILNRPRRGAGKRGKEKLNKRLRPRRGNLAGEAGLTPSSPPLAAGASVPPPAVESSFRQIVPSAAGSASTPPLAAIVEVKKRPKAFMVATVAIVAVAMLVGAATFLNGRTTSTELAAGDSPKTSAASSTASAAVGPAPAATAPRTPGKAGEKPEPRDAPAALEKSKARAIDHRSLREEIRAVREAARRALDARKRKRDEALAQTGKTRAAVKSAAAHPVASPAPLEAAAPVAIAAPRLPLLR